MARKFSRTLIIAEGQKVAPSRRFGFYRWVLGIVKDGAPRAKKPDNGIEETKR